MKKSISTKNQIIDTLQWSSEDYEKRVFQTMWNWCQIYGKYPSVIQQLLANSKINKWFLQEFEKCELEFLKLSEVVPNKVEPLRDHYKACTSQIMGIYPRALIEGITKNKEFSNTFLTNTIAYYAN